MRSRRHEIKLRLNDREYARLNEMVARSIFSREEFLRHMLAGYTLQEAPTEFLQFRMELLQKLNAIQTLVQDRPISDHVYQEIRRLSAEIGKTLHEIGEVYIPYYKQRGIKYDKS